MEKRKTKTTTSNEVIMRYRHKAYTQYTVALRNVEDAELIAFIEARKAEGVKTTQAVRELLAKGLENS